MNIGLKLLLVTLVSVIPAITIVGALNYFLAAQEITSDTLENLDGIATIQQNRINDAFGRYFERVHIVSADPNFKEYLKDFHKSNNPLARDNLEKILTSKKDSIKDIKEISIIKSNGIVSYSTNPGEVGKNYSIEKFFSKWQTNFHITINVIEDKGKLFASGPILDGDEYLGVLVFEMNFDLLTSITNDYSGLGNSGESFMAIKNENDDAIFISPLRFDAKAQFVKTMPPWRTDVPVTQALLTHEARYIDKVDYLGNPVFAVTRYIDSADIGLVVKVDQTEALNKINGIRDLSIAIGLTVGVIGTMASLFFADTISKPIEKLRGVTAQISKGNYSTEINISGDDEITKLATDVKTMANSLDNSRIELIKSSRLSAMGELSARMAHDLRNPVNVLKGALELMKPKIVQNSDSKTLERFAMIERSVHKITHQLDDVMDFVKTKPLELDNHMLSLLLNDAVSRVDTKGIKILLPPGDIELICDANRLEMVFVNLISNAVDAVHENGTIEIRATEYPEYVEIEIEDSGPGVPNRFTNKIFEPLFTTKEFGTGLGLPSCKSVIEHHGGTITVQNNPSVFIIRLPKFIK